jgi:hypothetical protein
MAGTLVGYDDRERFPRKCYDAANHRALRWFENCSRSVNTNTAMNGTDRALIRVAGFVDYNKVLNRTAEYSVIVSITGTKISMQYNRRKDHNRDTYYTYGDQLMIVDAQNPNANYLLAALPQPNVNGGNASVSNNGSSIYNSVQTGRIEVCQRAMDGTIDYLLISYSPFNGTSMCPTNR